MSNGIGESRLISRFGLALLIASLTPIEIRGSDNQNDAPPEPNNVAGIDYLHFWVIPQAQRLERIESVYDASSHDVIFSWAKSIADAQNSSRLASNLGENARLYETRLQPTGSPFFYATFGILQTGNFETDYWIFQTISSLLFVVAVCLLGRVAKLKISICILVCLGLAILYRPLRVDFLVANTNRIQLFMFGLIAILLAGKKPQSFSAGTAIGLAVAFKLNFLFLPIFVIGGCLVDKRMTDLRNICAGVVVGAILGVLAGAVYFGSIDSWFQWHDYVTSVLDKPYSPELGNYSTTVFHGAGSNNFVALGSMLLFWILCYAISVTAKRNRTVDNQLQSLPNWGAIGLLVFLLSCPLVWSHYFVLAVPSFVLILGKCGCCGSATILQRSMAVLLIIGSMLFVVVSSPFLPKLGPIWITAMLQGGVALLFAASLLSLIPVKHGCPNEKQKSANQPPGSAH